jgi:hypothetical protein
MGGRSLTVVEYQRVSTNIDRYHLGSSCSRSIAHSKESGSARSNGSTRAPDQECYRFSPKPRHIRSPASREGCRCVFPPGGSPRGACLRTRLRRRP